jgi:hypothetical protein
MLLTGLVICSVFLAIAAAIGFLGLVLAAASEHMEDGE